MNTPKNLNKNIFPLDIEDEERLLIEETIENIQSNLEDVTSIRCPKEIYKAARHLLGRGKFLRGILVILINRVYNFHNKEKALKLATIIELLHTASLIHDDIIDGAKIRRSVKTVHNLYGINVAITSGNLLISIAYSICADLSNKTQKKISEAGRIMNEAEVLECILDDPNLDSYFKIVDGKSSALIEAACYSSAIISGAKTAEITSFMKFGKLTGTVLQLRDDLLDYVSHEKLTGKSNPSNFSFKRINIVDILVKEKSLTLDEAITEARKMGTDLVDKALKEIIFIEPKKRKTFEQYVKFIHKRNF
jgi:octaprenyl-diphosphate synthase